jgi:RNA-directed DNA polymerase
VAVFDEIGTIPDRIGLRLAPEKTRIVHIDEGFDFLGFRIQRYRQYRSDRRLIYTFPSKKSVTSIKRKIKTATKRITHQDAGTCSGYLGR